MSSHSPFGSMRKIRPKGMSTHHRFPSRSNEGPSRKLSTCAPARLGSDQLVRRFLRNFAGSDVKGRAWMRLIFWKGLCTEKLREGAKHNPTRRKPAVFPRDVARGVRGSARARAQGRARPCEGVSPDLSHSIATLSF